MNDNQGLRQPPHSIGAEQEVIGGLFLGGIDAYDRVADALDTTSFYLDSHRRIVRHIRILTEQQKPFDVMTVSDAIEESNEVEQTGGLSYLLEIANAAVSYANIKFHVGVINDKRRLRDVIALAADMSDAAYSGNSASEIAANIGGALLELSSVGAKTTGPKHIAEVLGRAISEIETRIEKGAIFGLPTGFADLDRLTAGLHPGDLTIIAGRPSMGKTALAGNIAEKVVLSGKTALIFSLEMSDTQLAMRSLASVGGANLGAVRSGQMTDGVWDMVTTAIKRLQGASLFIDSGASYKASQMLAIARQVKRAHGLDLVMIDYLQLMTPEREGGNKVGEIGEMTRRLKLMARTLDCPVVVLSQLSRKVEERTDKHPMMSDLRDSGAIEQDADVIMMVYRDEYYNADSVWKGFADVEIVKNRMGETGMVRMMFEGHHSRFLDADPRAVRNADEASRAKPAASKAFRGVPNKPRDEF